MQRIALDHLPSRQRGISLVMSLIMLVVLTLIAASATYSTNSSIRIVGNMQMQDEALTAAQRAIDEQLDKSANGLANFKNPAPKNVDVDLNQDGTKDYTVSVAQPTCISREPKPGNSAKIKDSAAVSTYWEVGATVQDARTGTRIAHSQGIQIDMLPYEGCL